MSFKNKNIHDKWTDYKERMRDSFAFLISENLNLLKESNFESYLKNGNDENFSKHLAELSNNDFLILEKIVNEWFDFQNQLDAFYSERIKRFNRYG